MNMYTHLQEWLKLYQSQIGRELKLTDMPFLFIAPNGQLEPIKKMIYQHFAKIMKQWAEGSGIKKNYITHSHHHGGVQYYFMFALLHHQWTLHQVQ